MSVDLSKLEVVPVEEFDEREWISDLMSRYHELGDKKLIGNRIVYGIYLEGHIVGAFYFDKAVDRNKLREKKIGWDKVLRDDRRKHILNNSRFLITPNAAGLKNLASKALSLVTERLSKDFQKRYGIPVLAVETYVAIANEGTCYDGAGWENLGYSSGFEKKDGERTSSKWYFLKPLHKDSYKALSSEIPHALVTGVKPVDGTSNNNFVLDATKIDIESLKQALSVISDPRGGQGKLYKFLPFLSLCLSAVLSGHTQYRQIADWISKLPPELRARYGLRADKSPSESAVAKLLQRINPEELEQALTGWLFATYADLGRVIALDGKSLRATAQKAQDQKKFLNVYASELGVTIKHIECENRGEETKPALKALEDKALSSKVIVADAIHTKPALADSIKKKAVGMSSLSKTIREL